MTRLRTRGPRVRFRLSALLAILLCVLTIPLIAAGTPARAAGPSGQVYLVHGLVGEVLDIVVDGTVVAPAVRPKSIVGPLRLAPGRHVAQLRTGSRVRAQAALTVTAGASVDVVAHRSGDAGGTPALTVFTDDLSPVGPGKVRLAVAHTAAAPPADIRVDGTVLFSNVASGEALTLVVPAKAYSVDLVPTAASSPVILGPLQLTLEAGTLTRVFAVGDVRAGTMDAIVHQLPIPVSGAQVPGSVPTGDGGQLATWSSTPAGLLASALLGAFALALVAAGLLAPVRRR